MAPVYSLETSGNVSLNKSLWLHKGQQIILCDDQGKLRLYDIKEFLTIPKQDDFNKLTSILQKFK